MPGAHLHRRECLSGGLPRVSARFWPRSFDRPLVQVARELPLDGPVD
ncbi:hypothetical protein [Streptomyces tubercidicus]